MYQVSEIADRRVIAAVSSRYSRLSLCSNVNPHGWMDL